MGMSNYPPGVTGRELQIAGPDWEDEIEVTCRAKNVTWLVAAAGEKGKAAPKLMDFDFDECPYEGAVDAWGYHRVTHWTCPACGTEHDVDERDA